jgi:hypothetical protein
VFCIFDSHPRHAHPRGAGLIVNTSIDAIASHLDNILAFDAGLLADSSLQWQTQLLANFSGHFFVPKALATHSVEALSEAVLESSLAVLGLRAEVMDLNFQVSSLERDRQSLEKQLEELQDKYQYAKRRLDAIPRSCANCGQKPSPKQMTAQNRSPQPPPISGPSKLPSSTRQAAPSTVTNALEYFSSSANIIRSKPSFESADYLIAKQLQMQLDEGRGPSSSGSSYAQAVRSKPSDDSMDDYMVAAQLQMDWDQKHHDDVSKARAKQREFEEEDARIIAERAALQRAAQPVFECGVCFDKYPEDYVARIADCAHGFCRECMKSYVTSKLTGKLYPIFCPVCVTDSARVEPGSRRRSYCCE